MCRIFGLNLRSKILQVLSPVLSVLNWEPRLVKEYQKSIEEFWEVQEEIIEKRSAVHEKGSEPNDFLDSFLNKMKDDRFKGTSFEGKNGCKECRFSDSI